MSIKAEGLSRQDRIAKMTLENNIDGSALVAVSLLIGAIYFIIGSTWTFLDFWGIIGLKVILVVIALIYIFRIGNEYNQKMKNIEDIFRN